MNNEHFVGIDVSKSKLDGAHRPHNQTWQINYTDQEVATVVDRLVKEKPTLIVIEATGGLETSVVSALAAAHLPVVVVNPRQVRDFAKATGKLAKTDKIDAEVLAHFAEAVRPTVRPLPDEQTQALAALIARRRQILEMLTAEKNRLKQARDSIRTQNSILLHDFLLNYQGPQKAQSSLRSLPSLRIHI
jgi:transposase